MAKSTYTWGKWTTAVIVFISGIGGNLATEFVKNNWETSSDVMKTELVEVRAKVAATIDGPNAPKTLQQIKDAIAELLRFLDIYHSAEAQAVLKTGIQQLQVAEINLENAASDAEFETAVKSLIAGSKDPTAANDAWGSLLTKSGKRQNQAIAKAAQAILTAQMAAGQSPGGGNGLKDNVSALSLWLQQSKQQVIAPKVDEASPQAPSPQTNSPGHPNDPLQPQLLPNNKDVKPSSPDQPAPPKDNTPK
jgi:hypothetical protein